MKDHIKARELFDKLSSLAEEIKEFNKTTNRAQVFILGVFDTETHSDLATVFASVNALPSSLTSLMTTAFKNMPEVVAPISEAVLGDILSDDIEEDYTPPKYMN